MSEEQGVNIQEDAVPMDGMVEEGVNEEGMESQVGAEGAASAEDPLYVQKRLKRKEREHQRQMREMTEQLSQLQEQLSQRQEPEPQSGQGNGFEDDPVERAVRRALQQREEDEKRVKEQESLRYVQQRYKGLQEQLDDAADKYDDFDKVVRSDDAPYTDAIRDTALLLPNAADVLYELGKDREKLQEISKLHPLKQGEEVVKLAFALNSGGGGEKNPVPESMSQIKTSPVSKGNNYSVSSLRQKMKSGQFK